MGTKKIKRTATPKAGAATATQSKKATKPAVTEKEVDTANAVATTEKVEKKITKEKDLKYIYSADDDTLAKRKSFRTKVRAEMKKIEKLLAKLQHSELPEDMELYAAEYKKLEKARAKYYTKEYLATIKD